MFVDSRVEEFFDVEFIMNDDLNVLIFMNIIGIRISSLLQKVERKIGYAYPKYTIIQL